MRLFLTSAVVLVSSVVIGPMGTDPGTGRSFPWAQEPSAGSMIGDRAASDRGVDGEFLFNYYDQDGDHSPVTGGWAPKHCKWSHLSSSRAGV